MGGCLKAMKDRRLGEIKELIWSNFEYDILTTFTSSTRSKK